MMADELVAEQVAIEQTVVPNRVLRALLQQDSFEFNFSLTHSSMNVFGHFSDFRDFPHRSAKTPH